MTSFDNTDGSGGAAVPFAFEGHDVRVVERDGEPWFVAKDVADILGYTNPQKAVRDHCKGATPVGGERGVHPLGLDPQTVIIPERDVYRLIMRSKLPAAERFEEWVVAIVLPSIRKTGSYDAHQPAPESDEDLLARALLIADEKRRHAETRAITAEAQVEAARPKVVAYDRFINSHGLYGLQNAARVLGERPNKFIAMLKQGYLFYQGGVLVPKVRFREMGIFEVKCTHVDDTARYQTFITPKGIEYFAKKLGKFDLFGNAA